MNQEISPKVAAIIFACLAVIVAGIAWKVFFAKAKSVKPGTVKSGLINSTGFSSGGPMGSGGNRGFTSGGGAPAGAPTSSSGGMMGSGGYGR
jgi:hypothetical protein